MKHYGTKAHKAHVQTHFNPTYPAKPFFAWCELHGRLGRNGPIKGRSAATTMTTEAEAIARAKAHVS